MKLRKRGLRLIAVRNLRNAHERGLGQSFHNCKSGGDHLAQVKLKALAGCVTKMST